MPAWSSPSSTACGSMPVDAEAHDVRQPPGRRRIAVLVHPVEAGHAVEHPL